MIGPYWILIGPVHFLKTAKGQIKPKADWTAIDSPKKWTNEFGLFFSHEKQKKSFVFLGESTLKILVVSSKCISQSTADDYQI